MKRKDGRELVTEHPVTVMDLVEYVPRGELVIPDDAIGCRLENLVADSRGDQDPSSDSYDDWGA